MLINSRFCNPSLNKCNIYDFSWSLYNMGNSLMNKTWIYPHGELSNSPQLLVPIKITRRISKKRKQIKKGKKKDFD